jgi:hypothetical protein
MGNPRIPGGYFLLSRKVIESEIWAKPPLYIKVWIYLLSKAQHSDYKKLKRGQLFTSIPEIIEACSWKVGYRKEKPTKDQIYQVIDWLRKGNEGSYEGETKATMVTTRKATHGLLINIDNFDYYQTSKNYEGNKESNDGEIAKATSEQRYSNNINNNVKNGKNEKKNKYGDFVSMTIEEYQNLLKQFGEQGTASRIEKLNLYKGSTGKKYKSDYLTILNWENKNKPGKKIDEFSWEDL